MSYKNLQYERVKKLIEKNKIFNNDNGNGEFRNRHYEFVLSNSNNNLYSPVRDNILDYFKNNNIAWWNGKLTNHTLSSQVSCLNHLFPIRENKNSVLSMVKNFYPDIVDVLLIPTDQYNPAYIQFEAVSNVDHLNEKNLTRGRNCTSIDALIYGQNKDGEKILIAIEWKYVELYGNEDKASGERGSTRKKRYTDLINNSQQLRAENHNTFYHEPFYQLMRQTLWAEQMIAHSDDEIIKADGYIHIHVIPKENKELLEKKYAPSDKNMEDTWRFLIKDQNKYKILTPKELFEPISSGGEYDSLIKYLQERYW